jgi:hypothetical protein
MGNPTVDRINAEIAGGLPKIVNLTTAAPTYQMKPGDRVVAATSSGADNVGIVYLPSLAEACGNIYYISAPTGATDGDISIYTKETGAEYTGGGDDGDLDADGDYVILFAGATAWRTVKDGVA